MKPTTPKVEKIVKPKPMLEEVKRVALDESKKTFAVKSTTENNITKVAQKPTKKSVKKVVKKKPKKNLVKKKVIPKKQVKKKTPKKRQKRSKDALANMLMGAGTSLNPTVPRPTSGSGNYGEKKIKKLYGSEFNTYSPIQKKYILNNLDTIHKITQRTLTRNGYPEIAVRTRQAGTNIVSFYLHPNGDITGLKLKHRIGYSTLDDNTLKVIRLAYKDYPLPNEKTRLIFHVTYRLY